MIVAIDGPAGAGKSTVARAVASHLGYAYLDTGALYRAVTLAAQTEGVDTSNGAAVARLADSLDIELDGPRTLIDGRDVTADIRSPQVTGAVSVVAAHPEVREALVLLQRAFASTRDVVMEGRDIGSTIAPDAPVKVFLTASLRERARRRLQQLGLEVDEESVTNAASSIERRDRDDETRASSPLARPPDAVLIDSTDRSIEDVVEEIVDLVSARGRVT